MRSAIGRCGTGCKPRAARRKLGHATTGRVPTTNERLSSGRSEPVRQRTIAGAPLPITHNNPCRLGECGRGGPGALGVGQAVAWGSYLGFRTVARADLLLRCCCPPLVWLGRAGEKAEWNALCIVRTSSHCVLGALVLQTEQRDCRRAPEAAAAVAAAERQWFSRSQRGPLEGRGTGLDPVRKVVWSMLRPSTVAIANISSYQVERRIRELKVRGAAG